MLQDGPYPKHWLTSSGSRFYWKLILLYFLVTFPPGFSRYLLDSCKKHYQGMVLKARYPNRSRYLGAQQADAGSAIGYTATEVSNLRIILQPF